MSGERVYDPRVFLKGRDLLFFPFLLPAGRNADVMAGASAAVLKQGQPAEQRAGRGLGHDTVARHAEPGPPTGLRGQRKRRLDCVSH